MLYHLGSADIRDHFFERMPLDSSGGRHPHTLYAAHRGAHPGAPRARSCPLVSVGTHGPWLAICRDRRGRGRARRGQPPAPPQARADRVHRRRGGRSPLRLRLLRRSPPRVRASVAAPPVSPSTIASWRPARTASSRRRSCDGTTAVPADHADGGVRGVRRARDRRSLGSSASRASKCQAMSRSSVSTITRWPPMLDLTTVAQNVAAQGEVAAQLLRTGPPGRSE